MGTKNVCVCVLVFVCVCKYLCVHPQLYNSVTCSKVIVDVCDRTRSVHVLEIIIARIGT